MILYLLVLASWLLPYLFYWTRLGPADYDSAAVWAQIAVWWHQRGHYSVAWNPFLCGGYPLFGNPQLPLYHPATPLFLLFGPLVGLKLMVLIWMSAGFWLFRLLAEDYGFSREHSRILAAAWATNGYFVGHLGQMHAHFVCFFLIPGFYLLVRRWLSRRQLRYVLLLCPLMLVSGLDSYGFFAYFLISVPIFILLELWNRRLSWRETLALAAPLYLTLGVSLLLMAFYLLPVADYVRSFPRTTPREYENPFRMLTYLFFPGQLLPEHRYKRWEFQVFIGPMLFYFLGLGCLRIRRIPRDYRPLLLCGLLHLFLIMGSFRTLSYPFPSPFDLLHDYVPGFSNVRVTSRFWIGAIPGILLLSAWAWRERGITRLTTFLVLAPLFGFVLSNGFQTYDSSESLANVPRKPRPVVDNDFKWVLASGKGQLANMTSHTGIGNCYDSTPLPRMDEHEFRGPLLTRIPESMSWQRQEWGQLRFFRNSAGPAGEIDLNVNYLPKWEIRARSGGVARVLSAPREPIRIAVPAGAADFDLAFDDPSVRRGWMMTGVTALIYTVLVLSVLGLRVFSL